MYKISEILKKIFGEKKAEEIIKTFEKILKKIFGEKKAEEIIKTFEKIKEKIKNLFKFIIIKDKKDNIDNMMTHNNNIIAISIPFNFFDIVNSLLNDLNNKINLNPQLYTLLKGLNNFYEEKLYPWMQKMVNVYQIIKI